MSEVQTFEFHVWAEGVVTSTNGEPVPEQPTSNKENPS